MSTILVTGATGFIGSHLLKRLGGTHDIVHVACRKSPKTSHPKIIYHEVGEIDGAN